MVKHDSYMNMPSIGSKTMHKRGASTSIQLHLSQPTETKKKGGMPSDEDDLQLALGASLEKIRYLEKENDDLKQEILHLKSQISSLRAQNSDRKSMLWRKVQSSIDSSHANEPQHKPTTHIKVAEEIPVLENSCLSLDSQECPRKDRLPRVPTPPPRPSSAIPYLPDKANGRRTPPPPPPPPPPSKLPVGSANTVRRVPEVMEYYRSLTRRDASIDSRTSISESPVAANARNMIGEIENRSAYLLAIKSDVETQGEFIRFLIREVESAAYTQISDVEAFVKWLDEELSYLVDERAVLKHFPQWPERKADAMREAAFSYRDLKNLESEVSLFQDNPRQPINLALKRMLALQDRLERSIYNVERMRESVKKRYREFQIPWEWMLDTGLIGQLKLSSMRLAKEYMKRVANELKTNECPQEADLLLQAARFAFRVHQFAGGFNVETMQAFQELRKMGNGSHK